VECDVNTLKAALHIMIKMKLKDLIIQKVMAVTETYTSDKYLKIDNVETSESEQKLFRSMTRWHENIHLTDSKLISVLEYVSEKNILDVKEKMTSIPEVVRSFLKTKFKETSLSRRFFINELFEELLPNIKALYELKIESRDSLDEFGLDAIKDSYDVEKLVSGLNSEDLTFFEKTFVPLALFLVYKEIHMSNYVEESELLNDLFTIGSGSKSYDLIPEIVPFCQECLREPTASDVIMINKKVFKLQLRDKFEVAGLVYSDSSSSVGDKESGFNPFTQKLDHSDKESGFNPFAQKLDHSLPDNDIAWFECTYCSKQFSRPDFVAYHKSVFHKSENSEEAVKKVVIPNFVGDGAAELMHTFTETDPSPDFTSERDKMDPKVVVIPNIVGDVSSESMNTFPLAMGDVLCPDIEDEINCVPSSPESVEKKMSSTETRSRRAVRKVLKYPV